MNLHTASRQWATRPSDQRFWDLQELQTATQEHRARSVQGEASLKDLRLTVQDSDIRLTGRTGKQSTLGHFAFGQLSRLMGAPADYLRTLPAPIVADALNHSMQSVEDRGMQLLLTRPIGSEPFHCRAITTDRYSRIWNVDIVQKLNRLPEHGWKTPPARPSGVDGERTRIATDRDCLQNRMEGIGIKPGDTIAPAGLYASDKDMFCFFVNEDRPVNDGTGNPLYRGFFLENSEVGDRAFKLTTFLYNTVCGNHIVWGSSQVNEFKVVHRGSADDRAFHGLTVELSQYSDASVSEDEAIIAKARKLVLGVREEDVIEALFSKRLGLTQSELTAAYASAETHPEDGKCLPNTCWGMVQGITRMSQESKYADNRVRLDRCAGKVLQMAF